MVLGGRGYKWGMGQGGKQTNLEGEKNLNQPLRNVNIC